MKKTRAAYREYLKTDHWEKLRSEAIKRDKVQCRSCRASGVTLQAHHKFYRETWEQTKLEDLVTLCIPCHQKEHGLPEMPKPKKVTPRRSRKRNRKNRPVKRHNPKWHYQTFRNSNGGRSKWVSRNGTEQRAGGHNFQEVDGRLIYSPR